MSDILAVTDIGLVRKNNEDSYSYKKLDDNCLFAIVCDGVGGTVGGKVASQTACEVAEQVICSSYRDNMDIASLYRIMELAVQNANTAVYKKSLENPKLRGMGTTLVMAMCLNNKCYITYVGDSRAYLYRNGNLSQLTKDHSYVQQLLDENKITHEEAEHHPQKNIILKAIGVAEAVLPSYPEYEVQNGDMILLCTDGLTDMVTSLEISTLLDRIKNGEGIDILAQKANENGGADNITAIILSL